MQSAESCTLSTVTAAARCLTYPPLPLRLKIAVEGCCHGELDKIYATLRTLEEREGRKVDLLVCCGDFQVCEACSGSQGQHQGWPSGLPAGVRLVLHLVLHLACPPTATSCCCTTTRAAWPQAVRNLDDLETMSVPPKYRSMMTFWKYYSGQKVAPVPTIFSELSPPVQMRA